MASSQYILVALAAGLTAAGSVSAAGQGRAAQANSVAAARFGPHAVMMATPVRAGLETMIVADPAARVSPAWRVNSDLADKAGRVPEPTAGYTVTSRVIVRTDHPRALRRALGRRPAGRAVSTRDAGVRGYTIIEAGSVADAVALAGELRASGLVRSAELDIECPRVLRGSLPDDPLFTSQWHLRNTSIPDADVNAEAAWAKGYTGAGVIVGVTEGGFQTTHPDIAPHFNADASQTGGTASGHATSVAGVFGAVGNNATGVTGLAYDCGVSAQIYGTAAQTAAAFTYRNDLNDVKNDSWGPFDTGQLWDEFASSIELDALRETAQLGRGGLERRPDQRPEQRHRGPADGFCEGLCRRQRGGPFSRPGAEQRRQRQQLRGLYLPEPDAGDGAGLGRGFFGTTPSASESAEEAPISYFFRAC